MEYTAIGDNVNLAARLQTFATGGQIIISQSTFAAIRSSIQARSLPSVVVKGKHEPIPIYELVDMQSNGQ